MYHLFSPDNPFRSVRWRWERAELMANGQLPPSRKRDGDAWVRRAARFRMRFATCATELDQTVLAEDEPDIYWAHAISTGNKDDSARGGTRYEIEARILAGCDDDTIAYRCDVRPGIVAAYEQLFFNVRPKLDRETYILQQVLGPAVQRGISAREFDLLWKLVAYLRGVHSLEFAIRGWSTRRGTVPEADVMQQWESDQNAELLQQAGFTTKSLRIHSDTQEGIIKLFYQLRDMERQAGRAGAATKDAMGAALAVFIGDNNYRCGPPANDASDALSVIDRGPVELGVDALLHGDASPALTVVGFPPPGGREGAPR